MTIFAAFIGSLIGGNIVYRLVNGHFPPVFLACLIGGLVAMWLVEIGKEIWK